MNIAVILSAGKGSRFGSDLPKQYSVLNGVPVICKSIEKFEKAEFIDHIVMVCEPSYIEKIKELSKPYKKIIKVIEGGKRRQDSVFNALKSFGNNPPLKVWIHDAARPLFSKKLLERLYKASLKYEAVIPVVPMTDTIKELNNSFVKKTLDRENLFCVQTPQVFEFKSLFNAYTKFNELFDASDDAFLMEKNGVEVNTVSGEVFNIKVTYQSDIKIAEVLEKEVAL